MCDKNIDAELYAFLQSISMPNNGVTEVIKKDIPAQSKICEKIGVKSPKTYRAHLRYLIDIGYVIEEEDKYILPNVEDIYLLLPLDTLHFILDTNHFTVTWTASFFILFQSKLEALNCKYSDPPMK